MSYCRGGVRCHAVEVWGELRMWVVMRQRKNAEPTRFVGRRAIKRMMEWRIFLRCSLYSTLSKRRLFFGGMQKFPRGRPGVLNRMRNGRPIQRGAGFGALTVFQDQQSRCDISLGRFYRVDDQLDLLVD